MLMCILFNTDRFHSIQVKGLLKESGVLLKESKCVSQHLIFAGVFFSRKKKKSNSFTKDWRLL